MGLGAILVSSRRQRSRAGAALSADSDLVVIPAGEYLVGSDTGPANVHPAHRVHLASFAIGRHEVTVREYAAFTMVTANPYPNARTLGDSSLPATRVTWSDANDYCRWRFSTGGRLPTEDEWEATARGAEGRPTPWTDLRPGPRANLASANLGALAPVGSFPLGATPSGVHDLLGNAWEWTASVMIAYPGATPLPDSLRRYRIIRGGAFNTPDRVATSWLRGYADPTAPPAELANTGFRCVAAARPAE